MKPSFAVLLAGSASLALLPSCGIPAQPGRKAGDSMPYVSLWGTGSLVKEKRYELIGSPQQLEKVWSEHSGIEDPYLDQSTKPNESSKPEVDFGRCLIVAIFEGESRGSYGI